MQIHSDLSNLYKLEPLKTEFEASLYLDCGYVKDTLKNCPIRYIDIPWSVIINHNINFEIPYQENSFVVCQHIRYTSLFQKWKEAGVNTIFTPHSQTTNLEGMTVVGFPHLADSVVNAGFQPTQILNKNKQYDISFVGAAYTHWTRKAILDNFSKITNTFYPKLKGFFLDTGKWHFEKEIPNQKSYRDLYNDVLYDSKFSLCPRGTGPGTIRFWESLAMGAIPIVISDYWIPPESPNVDWDRTIIRITEDKSAILSISDIIGNFGPEKCQMYAENCIKAYREFSGANFINPILYHYRKKYGLLS